MEINQLFKQKIRDVADFPKKGILFKDITPIIEDPQASEEILNHLEEKYKNDSIDAIVGIESRGFLFGFPLALRLGLPFVMIRKKGKLPYTKIAQDYELEYGTATIEMHVDSIRKGQKVLIHDDLLATGGSADAAAQLVKKGGGEVIGFNFLVELQFLKGKKRLEKYGVPIDALSQF